MKIKTVSLVLIFSTKLCLKLLILLFLVNQKGSIAVHVPPERTLKSTVPEMPLRLPSSLPQLKVTRYAQKQ